MAITSRDTAIVFEAIDEPLNVIAQRVNPAINRMLDEAISFGGNLRLATALAHIIADGIAVVATVTEQHGRVAPALCHELGGGDAVMRLAGCQHDADGQAFNVGAQVDFRREAVARTTKGLVLSPPFAPAAPWCARTMVLLIICRASPPPPVRQRLQHHDAIVHCRSEEEARSVLEAIRGRSAECGLELHPEKTRTVYCKDTERPGQHGQIKFDFLGYTFQPRRAKDRWGRFFTSFLPAISNKAAKAIRQTIRDWRMASTRNHQRLEDLARFTNPVVRGWMNYYGRFYRSKCAQVLPHFNEAFARWARQKFKRFRRRERASAHWLGCIAWRDPSLFVLWQLGVRPEAGV
jgi:hypothetical protein